VLRAIGTLSNQFVAQLLEASTLRGAEFGIIRWLRLGVHSDSGLHCVHCIQSLDSRIGVLD
jgi:hypothetical protein